MAYSCPVCGKTFATELPAARHVLYTSDPGHMEWRSSNDLAEEDDSTPLSVADIWEE
ncbi:MAG: hypothetical protein SVU32_04495 [Candidatus Nanohaloarchaea archaeon]|nr:hypothetical protein [Candidatus Nanohaloarchaea archaeon]